MNVEDGRQVRWLHRQSADVVVVGSGPAGSAVARELARGGAEVVVLEEGGYHPPADHPPDSFRSMAAMYRDLGGTLAVGSAPIPLVQGRAVGGTSVVNGAISWRLPRDVHEGWVADDASLADAMPWDELEALFDDLEEELGIAPTDPSVAGPHNLLLAKGAEALGLEHRPISRNVRGCRGLGRCLQGCPEGHKQSMDVTLLAEAVRSGATVWSRVRVDEVRVRRRRAVAVRGRAAGGGWFEVRAREAVVLAASAVQTPAILLRSGLGGPAAGRGFQCHPGVAVAGDFAEEVRLWTGATQGHEVIGLRREGLKFEALGYDLALVASRLKGLGSAWSSAMDRMAHQAHWGAAVRAEARGRVHATRHGAIVRYGLTTEDVRKVRRGVRVLGQMLLAAGAERVEPGVVGFDPVVTDPRRLAALEVEGSLHPAAYSVAATHLFGTARMGRDPATSVVRPDFQVHGTDSLFVADSSVFPSNTGVNPQTSILAVASLAARRVAAR